MPALFDAQFYLRANPDVAAGVANGSIASAEAHFEAFGQFENRAPSAFFDPELYLAANPDVAAALEAGLIESAFTHFQEFGLDEGRNPSAFFNSEFYLASNPDVAAAVEAGTIASAFAHFAEFGLTEVRSSSPFFDLPAYLEANPDVAAAVQAGTITAYQHFVQFGFTEGRDLGNGVSLEFFASDPIAQAAIAAGDFDALFARVADVAPFIETFEQPAGYAVPANQPIPTNFVPNDGEFLVVPEGVTPPTTLPPSFEQPVTPPVDPTPPAAVTLAAPEVGDGALSTAELSGNVTISGTFTGTLGEGQSIRIFVEDLGTSAATVTTLNGVQTYSFTVPGHQLVGDDGEPVEVSASVVGADKEVITSVNSEDYTVNFEVRVEQPDANGVVTTTFYGSVANAFSAVADGATVTLAPGLTIPGPINLTAEGITINGNGATITGGGVSIAGDGTTLSGFTFAGLGAGGQPTAVFVDAADVTLDGNTFSTADAPNAENGTISTGVVTSGSATSFEFTNNTIEGGYRVGVYINPLAGADQADIRDNTFVGFEGRTPLVVEVNADGNVAAVIDNDFTETLSTRQISVEVRNDLNEPVDLNQFADNTFNDILPDGSGGTGGTVPIRVFAQGGNTVTGTDGNDRFNPRGDGFNGESVSFDGGDGIDFINGGSGNDTLIGGAGDDVINGRAGDDRIEGGLGADVLTSGTGNDTFVFSAGDSGTVQGSIDIITDFSQGDIIEFDGVNVLESDVFFNGSEINHSSYDAAAAFANQMFQNLTTADYVLVRLQDDAYLFVDNGDTSGINDVIKLQGLYDVPEPS